MIQHVNLLLHLYNKQEKFVVGAGFHFRRAGVTKEYRASINAKTLDVKEEENTFDLPLP